MRHPLVSRRTSKSTAASDSLIENLEPRALLSVTLHANYAGTLALTKALPAALTGGAPSRRLDFDLSVTSQGSDGQFTGDFSAGPLGEFAFEGSASGKNLQLIFEDNAGDAGVLTATLSRNGATLRGPWT